MGFYQSHILLDDLLMLQDTHSPRLICWRKRMTFRIPEWKPLLMSGILGVIKRLRYLLELLHVAAAGLPHEFVSKLFTS